MSQRDTHVAAFFVVVAHVGLLLTGFLVLADQFHFPDILRASSQERLTLFSQNAAVIVPAYYAMGLSGLTQIGIAVLFHRSFARQGSSILLLALVAGVCGGLAQAMGFMRWPIAVPFLAEQMAAATTPAGQAMVALVEGTLNRYAGMVIGEHLGFLGQGSWTLFVSAAMMSGALFSRVYGLVGIVLGVAILVSSLEQLGGPFESLGMVSATASAAWLGWLLMCGVSLLRTKPDGTGPKFRLVSLIALTGLMGGLAVTSLV
jgi:hypothetical protein